MTRWWFASLLIATTAVADTPTADAAAHEDSGFTLPPPAGRVQNRLLQKRRHVFVVAGPTLLERADYYVSPGISVQGAYFFTEDDGVELRATWLFSSVSASATEVLEHTKLELDAPQPIASVLVGWRHSLAFGKMQLGAHVVHFDVLSALHVGALFTSRGPAPAVGLAPGVLVRITPRVFVLGELGALATWEQRVRGPLALGFVPTLSCGVSL